METSSRTRILSLIAAVAFAFTTMILGYRKIGLPPVVIVGGSSVIALVMWIKYYLRKPLAPEVILPLFLLTVAALEIHMAEEYLTGFGPAMSRLFDISWTERSFLIVFAFVGPALYSLTALGLFYRVPFAGFLAWFIFIGPGVAEFTHFIFPLLRRRFGRSCPARSPRRSRTAGSSPTCGTITSGRPAGTTSPACIPRSSDDPRHLGHRANGPSRRPCDSGGRRRHLHRSRNHPHRAEHGTHSGPPPIVAADPGARRRPRRGNVRHRLRLRLLGSEGRRAGSAHPAVGGGRAPGQGQFRGRCRHRGARLGLHYFIACSMAVAFFLVARRVPPLRERPVPYGAAYGLLLYGIMNYIVVPLSAAGGGGAKDPLWVGLSVVVHMFLIGVPIALFVRAALREAPTLQPARG